MSERVVRLPDVGEGVAEAELVSWQVAVGDVVHPDSVLAEVLTDKATVEVFSPVAGRVTVLRGTVGEVLAVGSEFVVIETDVDCPGRASDRRRHAGARSAARRPEPSPRHRRTDEARDQDSPHTARRSLGRRHRPMVSGAPDGSAHRSPQPSGAPHHVEPGRGRSPRRRCGCRHARRASTCGSCRGADRPDGSPTPTSTPTSPAGRRRRAEATNRRRRDGRPRSGPSSGCAGGSPTGWRCRRRASRTSPTSTRSTSARSTTLRRTLNDSPSGRAAPHAAAVPRPRRSCSPSPTSRTSTRTFDDEAELLTVHGPVHVGIATQTPNGLLVPVVHDADTLDLWQHGRRDRPCQRGGAHRQGHP